MIDCVIWLAHSANDEDVEMVSVGAYSTVCSCVESTVVVRVVTRKSCDKIKLR